MHQNIKARVIYSSQTLLLYWSGHECYKAMDMVCIQVTCIFSFFGTEDHQYTDVYFQAFWLSQLIYKYIMPSYSVTIRYVKYAGNSYAPLVCLWSDTNIQEMEYGLGKNK